MPIDVKMPQLGESVTEGTIGRWLKQPGDEIAEYEPLLEVTTDKVDTEVPSAVAGVVTEILVAEGETVRVGTVIARLTPAAEGDSPASNGQAANVGASAPPASQTAGSATGPATSGGTFVSPAVARLVAEHNVDLKQIKGTGAGGRVTKKDVEGFVALRAGMPSDAIAAAPLPAPGAPVQAGAAAAPTVATIAAFNEAGPPTSRAAEEGVMTPTGGDGIGRSQAAAVNAQMRGTEGPEGQTGVEGQEIGPDDELIPLSPMRRAIAEHMVLSKQRAPHVTTVMEVDLSRVVAHRGANFQEYERQGVKLTYTAYMAEATIVGLQEVGRVNSSFGERGIVKHRGIHLGVAVAIPDGLIVPVIKDADEKSLLGLARAVNDLTERARRRRLRPDETRGGTFTITNHGVSGSLFGTPIINQPQAAILGIGAIQKRVVVVSEGDLDSIAIRPMCYLSLTFDHRILDGATADQFLMAVKQRLERYGMPTRGG